MQDGTEKILDAIARIETKIDFHKETIEKMETRVNSLEKRWLTALGAALLSIAGYIKSMFE